MSEKSTRSDRPRKTSVDKPKKPYKEFPLGPANNGRWQKRIKGTLYYFGRWGKVVNGKLERLDGDGWREALEIYKAQIDDIQAGRQRQPVPRSKSDELTIKELGDRFLTAKERKLHAGEMTSQTFHECHLTAQRLADQVGKLTLVSRLVPEDFGTLRAWMATQWGPTKLGNEISRTKSIFKWGFDNGLIDRPIRYGTEFEKPSKAIMRKHRAAGGQRLFTAEEVRSMLGGATPQLKAMILLAMNAGFGNTDCKTIPKDKVDLAEGWVRFPRPKTGIERRCPLWPETVEALKVAIAEQPPTGKAERLFSIGCGKGAKSVTRAMGRLLRSLGINGRRLLGFYTFRHTFRTIADSQRDFPAIRIIMGHADGSIDDAYREKVDDDRLVAVSNHVRSWVFPESEPSLKLHIA